MRFTIDRLDHLVAVCSDIELSASWYQRVLGMERAAEADEGTAILKFGGQLLILRSHGNGDEPRSTLARAGGADLCFVTAVGADDIAEHLISCGVTIKQGPVISQGALGELTSVYCSDPDGNLIEIGSYLVP